MKSQSLKTLLVTSFSLNLDSNSLLNILLLFVGPSQPEPAEATVNPTCDLTYAWLGQAGSNLAQFRMNHQEMYCKLRMLYGMERYECRSSL